MSMPTIEPEDVGAAPAAGGGTEAVQQSAAEAQEMLYQAEDKAINMADKVGRVAVKAMGPLGRLRQKIADKLNAPTE